VKSVLEHNVTTETITEDQVNPVLEALATTALDDGDGEKEVDDEQTHEERDDDNETCVKSHAKDKTHTTSTVAVQNEKTPVKNGKFVSIR
jgi:hypothetical protein